MYFLCNHIYALLCSHVGALLCSNAASTHNATCATPELYSHVTYYSVSKYINQFQSINFIYKAQYHKYNLPHRALQHTTSLCPLDPHS